MFFFIASAAVVSLGLVAAAAVTVSLDARGQASAFDSGEGRECV